jgi:predicted amidohydrolase YtcJ
VIRVVTADRVVSPRGSIGDAVRIENGRIVAIGSYEDLRSADSVEDTFVGGTIIAGLRDAHIHAVPYSALLRGCSLKSAMTIEDVQNRIVAYARTLRPGEPVVATRFDDESLRERRLPTRDDLDAAISDRPVVIYRYCGHVAVANSRALAESNISNTTLDPDGGVIDRDTHGRPTGVLRETSVGLIAGALARGGRLSPDDLLDGLRRLAGLGLTSIGAMIGYGESPSEKLAAEAELWREVARDLPIKVHGFAIADTPDQLDNAARTISGVGERLGWLGVKRFSDGSLGGHTAAMCSPFSDINTTGTYRLTPADAIVARHSLARGGMVAVHAIGDRAVSGVLDLFGELIADGANPADLRMEHVSVIDPEQIVRFARLGVTASVQPAFLASEAEWIGRRVGTGRLGWVYPFRSLLQAGIPMAGSSDSPVEPPHPLWGIAAAMDRYGVATDERLSGSEALNLFTSGGAAALREPDPLSAGSPADLVVLDVDPTTAGATKIHDATVLETYVNGDPVEINRSLPAWFD